MLAKLFAPTIVKILAGLSALLLVALAVQTIRANHYRDSRDQWKTAFDNQKAATIATQQAAKAKAIAAKLTTEARYRAEAEKANDAYQDMLARAQRASDAYAQRMRAKALGDASGRSPASTPGDGPEGPDRPRADAVVVGRDDFDILVENSVRLKVAHDWAKTLNVDPLPDPAFGQ